MTLCKRFEFIRGSFSHGVSHLGSKLVQSNRVYNGIRVLVRSKSTATGYLDNKSEAGSNILCPVLPTPMPILVNASSYNKSQHNPR